MKTAAATGAPQLICLNLQRSFLDRTSALFAPRGNEALVHAQSCLMWARRRDLPVVHVHSQCGGEVGAPIRGCEPKPSEPVIFKNGRSFFDSQFFANGRGANTNAFVLGFTGIHDCLAAALDAPRRGVRLVFIADAIASPALDDHPADVVDAVLASILGELSSCISTAELLAREQIADTQQRIAIMGKEPCHNQV